MLRGKIDQLTVVRRQEHYVAISAYLIIYTWKTELKFAKPTF